MNLESASRATGFFPFEPKEPLNSPFVHPGHQEVFEDVRRRPSSISACLLSDPDTVRQLFREKRGREMTDADQTDLNLRQMWERLRAGWIASDGRALSEMPSMYAEDEGRRNLRRI
jgi:hypothetical protein